MDQSEVSALPAGQNITAVDGTLSYLFTPLADLR